MATREEMFKALRNADAKGEHEDAERIAKMIQDSESNRSDASQGLEAVGRTALGFAGAIPQGIRAIGEAIANGPEGAMDRAGTSNFASMLPDPNSKVADMQDLMGKGMEKGIELGGRALAYDPLKNLNPEADKRFKWKADEATQLRGENNARTLGEVATNFLPIERGFKFAKTGIEKGITAATPKPKVDAGVLEAFRKDQAAKIEEAVTTDTEHQQRIQNYQDPYGPQTMAGTVAGYKNAPVLEAAAKIRPDVIPLGDKLNDPTLPRVDETLINRGADIERPLPQIMDPDELAMARALKGEPEPLRDPQMEMPPEQPMAPSPMGPPQPAPRAPQWSMDQPSTDQFGMQPAAATEALATNHTAPTMDFPLKTDMLETPKPQELFAQLKQQQDIAAKGGIAGRDAKREIQKLESQLRDWGWTGYDTDKTGLFGFGKDTLAPIEKSSPAGPMFGGKGRGGSGIQSGSISDIGNSPVLKIITSAIKKLSGGEESRPAFHEAIDLKAAVKGIPGVRDLYNGIDSVDPKTVLQDHADMLDPKYDFTKTELATAQTTSSGANMKAKSTNNPFVRATYTAFDNALKTAAQLKKELAQPFADAHRKMSRDEEATLWALLREAEGKQTLTSDQLRRYGMNEKQVNAYEHLRNGLDKTFEQENLARASQGKKPIPARPGYLASKFIGEFKTIVKDEKGQARYLIAEHTKSAHDAMVAKFKALEPGLTLEEIPPFEKSKFQSKQAAVNYAMEQIMREITADDPMAARLDQLAEKIKADQAEMFRGQNQHMKSKSKEAIGGAEGMRKFDTAEENARRGFEAQFKYMDNGLLWSEMQKAYSSVGDILQGTQDVLPRASEYMQSYRDQAIGRNSNTLGKISDLLMDSPWARKLGLNNYQAERMSGYIKAGLNAKFLGGPLNVTFMALQLLQTLNAIPELISVRSRAGLSIGDFANAVARSTVDAAYPTSKVMRDAMEWGSKNGVTRAAHWDDIQHLSENRALKIAGQAWNGIPKLADASSRRFVYAAFVNLLKDHYSGEQLYRMAADATERSMVDYRGIESPMGAQSGGVIGRNIMFLHKYPANLINQLAGFYKSKEYAPLFALVGTMWATGGLSGMIGIQQAQQLIDLWNTHFGEKYRLPSPKEAMMRAKMSDTVIYGPVSSVSGVDISSRASMGNLMADNPADNLFPGISDVAKTGGSLLSGDPKQIVHQAMPNSAKWVTEENFYTHKNPETGLNEFKPPNKKGQLELKNTRDGFDTFMRRIGGRSLKETRENDVKFNSVLREGQSAQMRDKVMGTWTQEMSVAKTPFEMQKATEKAYNNYVAHDGLPKHFQGDVAKAWNAYQLDFDTRQKLKAQNNPQAYQRYQELQK